MLCKEKAPKNVEIILFDIFFKLFSTGAFCAWLKALSEYLKTDMT